MSFEHSYELKSFFSASDCVGEQQPAAADFSPDTYLEDLLTQHSSKAVNVNDSDDSSTKQEDDDDDDDNVLDPVFDEEAFVSDWRTECEVMLSIYGDAFTLVGDNSARLRVPVTICNSNTGKDARLDKLGTQLLSMTFLYGQKETFFYPEPWESHSEFQNRFFCKNLRNHVEKMAQKRVQDFGWRITMSELAEAAVDFVANTVAPSAHNTTPALDTPLPTTFNDTEDSFKENEEDEDEELDPYAEFSFARDLDSVAMEFFGGSLYNVISAFPAGVRVTGVENIMREDLRNNFLHKSDEIYAQLRHSHGRGYAIQHASIQMAFHGTNSNRLRSIVKNGLVVPDYNNIGVGVVNGTALGKGIYTALTPEIPMGYVRGESRLLVLAICCGAPGNHCVERGDVRVLLTRAQVLPCFLVSFVWSNQNRGEDEERMSLREIYGASTSSDVSGVAHKERVEELTARARAHLPFGFGPSDNFQVLEIAEYDDDEDLTSFETVQAMAHVRVFNEFQSARQ